MGLFSMISSLLGGGNSVEFDITNAEVQGILQNNDELLESLHSFVEDDMGTVVYEGANETHYAVVEIWWMRIAAMLDHPSEKYDDPDAYFINLYTTEAFQDHMDRVEDLPELDFDLGDTAPFVVEHNQTYPQPPNSQPFSSVVSDSYYD